MRRHKLAAGEASSQIYAASEAATQQQWDLAFLTPRQFTAKYHITLALSTSRW
jgi:hypothetical protein